MKTALLFSAPRFLICLLGVLLGLNLSSQAQTSGEAQAHRTAIDAFYPVMIAHVNAGRLGEARTLCQQAIAWEPNNPVHQYNLGCIESKAGRPDQAIAALKLATANGYNDPSSLRTDADLAAVRSDPRFAAVLQSAARNSGATAPAPNATSRPVAAQAFATAPPAVRPAAAASRPAPGPTASPAPAVWNNGKLQGLFFMTRFWSMNSTLEMGVWYFAPDGRVYHDLQGGFSAAELAADKAQKGTYSLAGGKLSIRWADGKTNASEFQPSASGFGWDGGIFTAVKPFAAGRNPAGRYEGGSSISGGTAVSRSLDLRADGTFGRYGVASVSSTSAASKVTAGSQGGDGGRWALAGYSLTLTDAQGKVTRGIAFPYDDPKTAVYPDRFYFAGTMYKKQ
jgi:hypothetical protein